MEKVLIFGIKLINMTMNKDISRKTILKFLSSISSEKEIRKYIERFSSDDYKFAIVKAGGLILKEEVQHLVASIGFLYEIGLKPIIVHGAGPQINEALKKSKIKPSFINGHRITDANTLKIVISELHKANENLCNELHKSDVKAYSCLTDIFKCNIKDRNLGLVGEIYETNDNKIKSLIRDNYVPVISPLGLCKNQTLNINADSAANAISKKIQPDKVIFLTSVGGIFNQNNELISNISLKDDFDDLMKSKWLHSGMRLKLEQVKNILNELPTASSVSITNPKNMTRELFTDNGFGTMVKLGHTIQNISLLTKQNKLDIQNIIESSFKGKLIHNYYDSNKRTFLLSDCNRAVISISELNDFCYMDKFAVLSDARGEGLGSAIWKKMVRNNKKIFWRSRISNPINNFYKNVCDGFQKNNQWLIFWIGENQVQEIAKYIEYALNQPETIIYE